MGADLFKCERSNLNDKFLKTKCCNRLFDQGHWVSGWAFRVGTYYVENTCMHACMHAFISFLVARENVKKILGVRINLKAVKKN